MRRKNFLVSIIVRTKDRPKLLESALQTIAFQTYRPIEVILVNDGGCDLDIEKITSILQDVLLNYIRLEKNKGRAHAGNAGIHNAKGSYIGFLDDDDELYPEHVATLISYLPRSDFKVAYTDSLMAYKEYDSETKELSDKGKELVFSEDFDYAFLIFENYIPFMCLLFERETLINSGGFDNSFNLYEDWDLLIRIGEKHPFHHIKKVTAEYNQWSHELQISQRNKDPQFLKQSYLKVLSKHKDMITLNRIYDYMSNYVHTRNLLREAKNEIELFKSQLREAQIVKLYAELKEKYPHLSDLNTALKAINTQIVALEVQLKERESQVLALQSGMLERDALITAMRKTRGWRVLEKCRRLRNGILSPWYKDHINHLVRGGLNVLKHEGLKSLLRKANKKLLFRRSIKKPSRPIEMLNVSRNTFYGSIIAEPIRSRVSVIIPTKNAGEEFAYTLRRITEQEGLGEIELIIVDSGSNDMTIDISKSYTQKVFHIQPKDFHHARTRNFGAEKATGEYLIFTVQDAIPVGKQWLYKLLYPIYREQAVAVSVRQIPRSDADLFASWGIWSHNHYMGYDLDRICYSSLFKPKNFDNLEIREKRAVANLDNVCLGIKREVFYGYQFRANYAEDLELGIRLIKDGHSLAFQSSNAVIHSHNRPALYFLKRSYVDTVSLSNILQIKRRAMQTEPILEAISFLYCTLKMCISMTNLENGSLMNPDLLIHSLIVGLSSRVNSFDPSWKSLKGDSLLDDYFKDIPPSNHREVTSEMYSILISNLGSFADFLKNCASVEDKRKDFQESLYKFFANMSGHYLGVNTCDKIDSMYDGV